MLSNGNYINGGIMKSKWNFAAVTASAALMLFGTLAIPAGASGKVSLATYAAQLKAGEAAAKWAGPTTPAKAPKHMKIVIVTCDETLQGCKNLTQGTVDAAKALGWTSSVVDVTNSSQYSAAVQTAVSEGVNGIVAVGVDSALMSGGLAAAHAAKIPVVSLFQYNVPSATGVAAEVSPNATTEGKLLADSMIVNTKGKVNVLVMNDSEYSLPIHVLTALKAQLNACRAAKVCSVTYAPPITS
jgi:ribose transport system substrate-binding protein